MSDNGWNSTGPGTDEQREQVPAGGGGPVDMPPPAEPWTK